jgi:hypothetical protein
MKKKNVKVLIPIYKTYFGELEQKSFLQCVKVLKDHEIVLVQPEGLDNSFITNLHAVSVENFPKKYFQDIHGYNELLLTSGFYERFEDTEYVLIYQLDAFVFKDELKFWCEKGYDYIGAPWIATQEPFFLKHINDFLKFFKSYKVKRRDVIFYKVGNGGFSLRRIASHLKIAKDNKDLIFGLIKNKDREICAIEDVFWSLKAPEISSDFKIPGYKEALGFAIDRKPKLAMALNNHHIPFGCHAINKPKVIDFWKPILAQY